MEEIKRQCARPECGMFFVPAMQACDRHVYCSQSCGKKHKYLHPLKCDTFPESPCANLECLNKVQQDKYHPGLRKYCSSACRSRHRNKNFGRQDQAKWKQNHPDEYRAAMDRYKQKTHADPDFKKKESLRNKNSKYKSQYGITLEQKEARLASQDFKCANPGCRTDTPKGKGWVSDHCHSTGKLRGELCTCCNVALGMVHDNPTVLDGLVRYLKLYE